MVILENEYLTVELEPKGAEISKIVGKQDGLNYMWRQDPVLWGHSAPVLFPIVGALQKDECRINGSTYKMTQHGFSRNTDYAVDEQDDHHVVFHLTSSDDIKATMYPFDFDLYVTYTLEKNVLMAEFKVVNAHEDEIYFQIGGHPAFACPLIEGEDANDYYLEFEKGETVERKVIDVVRKGMSRITEPFFENERHFFVRQSLFDRDAIVLKDFVSEWVALKSLCNDKSLVFHMHGFEHVGIWASKHVGGLIAIEPWVGHSDYVDFTGEFKEKESVVTLKKGETFTCDFAVEINQ